MQAKGLVPVIWTLEGPGPACAQGPSPDRFSSELFVIIPGLVR